jgi:arsenate reductase (glutaredoxin)
LTRRLRSGKKDAIQIQRSVLNVTVKIYGIKNCDTMKKAFVWLETHGVDYDFHDYKKAGIDAARVEMWCAELGWDKVLNKAGTTFKKLPDADKQDLDAAKAVGLMVNQPSMIKRPVVEFDGRLMAGFKPDLYAEFFRK